MKTLNVWKMEVKTERLIGIKWPIAVEHRLSSRYMAQTRDPPAVTKTVSKNRYVIDFALLRFIFVVVLMKELLGSQLILSLSNCHVVIHAVHDNIWPLYLFGLPRPI